MPTFEDLIKISSTVKFFGNSLKLEEIGWDKLNYRWIGFFIFLALINELIWRTQSEEFWVNFKVWGILPLTFIFTLFQVSLIQKYKNLDFELNMIDQEYSLLHLRELLLLEWLYQAEFLQDQKVLVLMLQLKRIYL